MDQYDMYAFDTGVQHFIRWAQHRLRMNKRDTIDHLIKRMIADRRLPRQGSRGWFVSHLKSKGYSADDLQVFETAWSEMRAESFSHRGEKHHQESEEPL